MRMVIDCFKLIKGTGKSIGIYNVALNLAKNLVAEQKVTTDVRIKNCELIVLGNGENRRDFDIPGLKFVEIRKYNPQNRAHIIFWELFAVSKVCKKLRADRVIFPRGFCAMTHPVKDTVIIHDLIPFYYAEHFPDVFNRLENAYIMHRLKMSAKTCNQIITISNASKNDILKYCNVDEGKIKVIYNACSEIGYQSEKKEQGKGYICAITSGLPHKNAVGVLKSYKRYCELCTEPLSLVVIGIDDTSICDMPEVIRNRITCFKFIRENVELHRIIANSDIFLFLSLTEGFGLPPLEAMQLGVPVICSNTSSLPEVVGDAAVLVNPKDPDEVAQCIDQLSKDTLQRENLIRKGHKNTRRFLQNKWAQSYWNALMINE